jgi:hypothetical protein
MVRKGSQRDFMKRLVRQFGRNEEIVVAEYARAEEKGLVLREKNTWNISALAYARALWRDGVRRGWLG